MLTQTSTYLGPATVTRVEKGRLCVALPGGPAWATLALACPYHPEPGDTVLVIGDEEHYVIGVLEGRGRVVLAAEGDLDLRATGRIRIRGNRAVEIESARVGLKADKLEMVARISLEKMVSCYRWVKDCIQTRAGRTRMIVDGDCATRAGRIVESAVKDVKVNGRTIHLG